MPITTASSGVSLSFAPKRAELPCAMSTTSPSPDPSSSTATMVLVPDLNCCGFAGSTRSGRTKRNFEPVIFAVFLVATTVPSTRARIMGGQIEGLRVGRGLRSAPSLAGNGVPALPDANGRLLLRRGLRQYVGQLVMRAGDHADGDDFAE